MVLLWRFPGRACFSLPVVFSGTMRIEGKVALITGASAGIGAACAAEFARSGARLSLCARSEEGLRRAGGDQALITAGDLTDEAVRRRVVERTIERYGAIDILINNAGAGLYIPSWEAPDEEVRRLMELNFFALLGMVRLVAPHMRARHSGTIVNVGSIGGKVVLPWLWAKFRRKWCAAGASPSPPSAAPPISAAASSATRAP